jgi:hypothetical protein
MYPCLVHHSKIDRRSSARGHEGGWLLSQPGKVSPQRSESGEKLRATASVAPGPDPCTAAASVRTRSCGAVALAPQVSAYLDHGKDRELRVGLCCGKWGTPPDNLCHSPIGVLVAAQLQPWMLLRVVRESQCQIRPQPHTPSISATSAALGLGLNRRR